jgi:hypothetical protein
MSNTEFLLIVVMGILLNCCDTHDKLERRMTMRIKRNQQPRAVRISAAAGSTDIAPRQG